MKFTNFLVVSALVLGIAACSSTNNIEILTVNSAQKECEGVGKKMCYQIKKGEAQEWELFYSDIEGFDYEPGFVYTLKVKTEELDPKEVPADASSLKYTLVEVVSSERDMRLNLNRQWTLIKMEQKDISEIFEIEDSQIPKIEFHVEDGKFHGFDGCNSLSAQVTVENEKLNFGPIAGTRKMCMNMDLPDNFNRQLSMVTGYKIQDELLLLTQKDGKEILTFRPE